MEQFDKNRTLKRYDRENKTNHCFGLHQFIITKQDINHLLEGGKLYGTIGWGDEYAIEIILKEK